MAAISVEGLGKRYALEHLQGRRGYATFRGALAEGVARLGRRLTGRFEAAAKTEEFWALRNIDLKIGAGERVGIIGRNGAGKSTLLKLLSRIVEPTEGRIRIRGRMASLLEVGTGFHPELTGRENIFFNGVILGMSRAEIRARFDEIVAFAEVERFLDTPVKHYSSGMYVRLGFAVAAHLDPEILILDEVLAVGDAQFQKKCLGKMEEIGRQGRTVLFVSHNMGAMLQFTERAALLDRGRLVAFTPTADCVARYLKLNEEAHQARDLPGLVPWLRVERFALEGATRARRFNETLRFRICLDLQRPVKNLLLALHLGNTVGARLLLARGGCDWLPAGRHVLSLELADHRLLPGTYFVQLNMRQGEDLVFRKDQIIALDLLLEDDGGDRLLSPLLTRQNNQFGCYCPLRVAVADGPGAEHDHLP
jgi:lipopolysaccharide transport system ATP-binding protein